MRDWLSLYRNGGFEALYPKSRADRGPPRRLPPEVAEWLIALKTEQPALSVKALIGAARERGVEHPLAPLNGAPAALARGPVRLAPRRARRPPTDDDSPCAMPARFR